MSPIRLLTKPEIDRTLTGEKSREIAEGQKVARQVRALRDLRATEEDNLEKYRAKTLEIIQGEIKDLIAQKGTMEAHIRQLDKEIGAKQPYIEQKLAEIEKINREISSQKVELENRVLAIKEREKNIADEYVNLDKKIKAAELKEKEGQRLQEEGGHYRDINKKENQRIILQKEKFTAETKKIEEEFEKKEKELNEREAIVIKDEKNNAKEAEQNRRDKIWIADRRAMLQRAAERLKGNK